MSTIVPTTPGLVHPPRTTPAHRDSAIDLVRAACVIGVVALHSLMVGVGVSGAAPVFTNAAEGTAWIVPLSWMLQVMPLFFVIGGFAGLTAYRRMQARGGGSAEFAAARLHRLARPAIVVIAIAGAALTGMLIAGVDPALVAIAGFRYGQPLWFLAVFLGCQALLPALAARHERAPLRTLGTLVGAALLVDVVRIATGVDAIGLLNLAFVWLALQQLGFLLADGRIDALSRRARVLLALAAAGLLAVDVACGIHSADLVTNLNPPTTALLLVGAVHTLLFSLHRERLAALSHRPAVAAVTRFVTARTMTIYLWHMPVLLAMAGLIALAAIGTGAVLPAVGSGAWWLSRPLWLVAALGLTALVAVVMGRVEHAVAPALTASMRRISVATVLGLSAVVLLLAAGVSPLTAAIAVATLVASLRLVRARSTRDGAVRIRG